MEILTLNEKLNSVFELKPLQKYIEKDKITFACGNYIQKTAISLKDKVVYGKVAIFAFENTFVSIGASLKRDLLRYKITSMDYTLTGKESITIDTISKLFVLPDDIRAIIVLDGKLSKIGDYFAYCKRLPVVDISCGLDIGEYLENSFFIRNGNNYDELLVNIKKIIVVDTFLAKVLNKSKSYAYDYVVNNIVSMIDIRINAMFSGCDIDVGLYNIKSKAISSTFAVMKEQEKNMIAFLTVNCAMVGLVNRALSLSYLENNSLHFLSILYFGDMFFNQALQLNFSKKIMEFYLLLFKTKLPLHLINDYNEATTISEKLLSINQEYFLDNLFVQEDIISKSNVDIELVQEKFKKEVMALSNNFGNAIKTHILLGGKEEKDKIDNERLKNCFKAVGTLSKNINGLVLMMREGLTSLI